ncbi:MAG: TolB-like protein [Gammaproteobacteria bacterium]
MESFVVNDVHVDVPGNRLVRGEQDVHVEPKVMRLLCCLADKAGEVVPRTTLLDIVWAGQVVEDDALSASVIKLRKALGDSARDPRFIATVPKVGYRLFAKLTLAQVDPTPSVGDLDQQLDSAVTPQGRTARLASAPVVTVLPFENRSHDADQQFLADGLAEDIAGALSRLRWLTIVDCSITLRQTSRSAVRQVALDVGVDFIVRGSVRRGGDRLRVAVVLERAESGEHVWSERYDRDINAVFQIENDICMYVLASLEVEISAAEQRRIRIRPPTTLSAWEAYQCGLAARQGLVGVELKAAKVFFRQAIDLDPEFSAPKAALALAVANELGWALVPADDREATEREAMSLAVDAIRVDPREALGFAARARLHLHEGRSAAALDDAQAALERNPNSSTALLVSALVQAVAGDARQALSDLEAVVRLSPFDPYVTSMRYGTASFACLRLGDYEQAIRWGEAGMQALQSATWSCALAAAANIALGKVDRAEQIVAELMARRPEFTVSDMLGKRASGGPEFRGWLIERLREAGFPD